MQYFDHVRRYLFAQQFVTDARVLDIACGTGYGGDVLLRGRARQMIGMDISRDALDYAARRWKARCFVKADAQRLPLPDGAVDVIVSFETLEHLPEPPRFLAEARRVLRADGWLILSTPNRAAASPGSATPFSPYHTFEPTRTELIALLEGNGWSVVHLYGMTHSQQAARILRPTHGPYDREASQGIAWGAYIRLWMRGLLPPVIYGWLRAQRGIPALDMADSVIVQDAGDDSAYFIAVCKPA